MSESQYIVCLNLLDDKIIFLSTEGFRLAGLGHNSENGSWQKTVNLMWLTVPVTIIWRTLMGSIWSFCLLFLPPELETQYHNAVLVVAVTGVQQILAEPPMVVGQVMMLVRMKVIWMITGNIVLCLAVRLDPDNVIFHWAHRHALASLLYVLGPRLSKRKETTINSSQSSQYHIYCHPNHYSSVQCKS